MWESDPCWTCWITKPFATGASQALALAAQSGVVDAVVAYEPVVNSVFDDQEQAALGDAVARMGELAAEGGFTDAARALAGFPFTDADIDAADGHAAPLTHPEALAEALTEFFAPAQESV